MLDPAVPVVRGQGVARGSFLLADVGRLTHSTSKLIAWGAMLCAVSGIGVSNWEGGGGQPFAGYPCSACACIDENLFQGGSWSKIKIHGSISQGHVPAF